MSYRLIAVAAALCGWATAGTAGAADAIAASPVSPLGTPQAGLVDALARQAPALDRQVLALATEALQCARQRQQVGTERVLSVIDYSRPSTERRLWVFDLARQRLLFEEWVAHGRNTGNNLAAKFSNDDGSFQSSLGAFTAQEAYTGHNGYSLRLKGLEPGFNDHARDRAIVIHGAPYVSEAVIRSQAGWAAAWVPGGTAGGGQTVDRYLARRRLRVRLLPGPCLVAPIAPVEWRLRRCRCQRGWAVGALRLLLPEMLQPAIAMLARSVSPPAHGGWAQTSSPASRRSAG